jgi:hypothetical protein
VSGNDMWGIPNGLSEGVGIPNDAKDGLLGGEVQASANGAKAQVNANDVDARVCANDADARVNESGVEKSVSATAIANANAANASGACPQASASRGDSLLASATSHCWVRAHADWSWELAAVAASSLLAARTTKPAIASVVAFLAAVSHIHEAPTKVSDGGGSTIVQVTGRKRRQALRLLPRMGT